MPGESRPGHPPLHKEPCTHSLSYLDVNDSSFCGSLFDIRLSMYFGNENCICKQPRRLVRAKISPQWAWIFDKVPFTGDPYQNTISYRAAVVTKFSRLDRYSPLRSLKAPCSGLTTPGPRPHG